MSKVVGAIFGAPDIPEPQIIEKEDKSQIDPNRQAELAAAAKRRRSVFSRRGRRFLRSGGQTRGGVSFGGGAGGGPTRGPAPGGRIL